MKIKVHGDYGGELTFEIDTTDMGLNEYTEALFSETLEDMLQLVVLALAVTVYVGPTMPVVADMLTTKLKEFGRETAEITNLVVSGQASAEELLNKLFDQKQGGTPELSSCITDFIESIPGLDEEE